MRLVCISVNHRQASVAQREKLSLDGRVAHQLRRQLADSDPSAEAVILCTCNRTEIYIARKAHGRPSDDDVVAALANASGQTSSALAKLIQTHHNEQAIAHLFAVVSGLDSMVLGETQIVGQVRQAYEQAGDAGTVGPMLHALFQRAAVVSRQVRRETGIDQGRMSVASVAIDMCLSVFESMDDKTVVCIGTGEMSKLMLLRLGQMPVKQLVLVNRSLDRAGALSQLVTQRVGDRCQLSVAPLDDLDHWLTKADVVLSCTGAPQPIVAGQCVSKLLPARRHRPLCLLDLAVPRDIEPDVADLPNVFLYDLDDLQRVVETTSQQRGGQVEQARTMIDEQAHRLRIALSNRDQGVVIRRLRNKLHQISQAERQRTTTKLRSVAANGQGQPSPDQQQAIEKAIDEHTRRVINKLLHLPLSRLHHRDAQLPSAHLTAALDELFELRAFADDGKDQSSASEQANGHDMETNP